MLEVVSGAIYLNIAYCLSDISEARYSGQHYVGTGTELMNLPVSQTFTEI
jgi:hypothetical protein